MEEYLEEYLVTESLPVFPQQKKRMRGKNKSSFNTDEKKRLAFLVKEHPSLWCLEEKSHSNLSAINADWRQISLELDKSVDDCKANWKSLRDSHRYHNAPRKIPKSGSAAEELSRDTGEFLPVDNADWEFSACLAFLTPASSKRKTFTSAMPSWTSALSLEESEEQNETPCSSSYTYNTSKPQKKDAMAQNVTNLTQTVAELIQMRRDDRDKNGPAQPPLVNYSLLANLDRILKKLPEDTVEELGLSFQQQAMAAVREEQKKNNKSRSPGH